MSFVNILELCFRVIGVLVAQKEKREKLELQLYEFARKFDKNAIDGNTRHREEYKKLREQLRNKRKEKK